MNKVDIIVPVCGAIEAVQECIESLYPLPENWELIVYLNKMSEIDGTTKYILDKQKELKFKLIDEGVNVRHGQAVKSLLKHSSAPWILHLDSDSKLLDRNFYDWVEYAIHNEKFKVWGRVDTVEPMPEFKKNGSVRMLRTQSWNLLFERKYILDNGLNFSDSAKIEAECTMPNIPNKKMIIWGDASWEYFWKASRDDLFGRYPDNAWKCLEHKNHTTIKWRKTNALKIKILDFESSKFLNINEDTPQETLIIKIENTDVLFKIKSYEKSEGVFYYIDASKNYFLKIVNHTHSALNLKRELVILRELSKYQNHFPRIIDFGENYSITSYCGEMLSPYNIPNDAYKQIDMISRILKTEEVFHLNIKLEKILTKDGKLFLVGFERADMHVITKDGPFPDDDFRLNYLIDETFKNTIIPARVKYKKI